jgi:hypoxanthine-DNA glycosylase
MDIREYHPYKPYIPPQAKKLIVGNFPIGKFSNPSRFHERKDNEMDFYYGGASNKLWRLLGKCFNLELSGESSIKSFLKDHHFALADILLSCRRIKGSALDSALYDKVYNHELKDIIEQVGFKELIFTSKHVASEFKKHIGRFPEITHTILISPSPTAVRGLVKNREYLALKEHNPKLTIEEFRLMKYKQVFS